MRTAFLPIFWGGLICGICDITQAMIAWNLQRGVKPIRILQSVAAGALGRASFNGGWRTAALGLFFHFLIAFSAATAFYIVSRYWKFLTNHPVAAGLIYGEVVWLVMTFVVIPLSATRRGPWDAASIITGPIGHTVLVGLPVSLAVRRFRYTGEELPAKARHQIA